MSTKKPTAKKKAPAKKPVAKKETTETANYMDPIDDGDGNRKINFINEPKINEKGNYEE